MFQTDFSTWRMLTKLSTIKVSRALLSFGNRVFFFKLMHSVPLGDWGSSASVFTNLFIFFMFVSCFNKCLVMFLLQCYCLCCIQSVVFPVLLVHTIMKKCFPVFERANEPTGFIQGPFGCNANAEHCANLPRLSREYPVSLERLLHLSIHKHIHKLVVGTHRWIF